MDAPSGLSAEDLPQVYRAADVAAIKGRRSYMGQTGARLLLVVVAAAVGVPTLRYAGLRWADILSCVAFLVALMLEVSLLRSRPEHAWYDGRALAESAKTLAWKWAVCGTPYSHSNRGHDPVLLLADDLRQLRAAASELDLAPIVSAQVSDAMRALRAASLDERRRAYLAGRVADQLRWYATKASQNDRASRRWRLLLILLEGAGGLVGVLNATGVAQIPLGALLASGVGAVGAWLEAQQHGQVARAYSVAVADLVDARARLEAAKDEASWAASVNDTEDAISREHTVWRATRSQP